MAVVQYTFTHKQYTEQHNENGIQERNIYDNKNMGRDSSVGIATRYGLDCPEMESRWEARFSAPVQTGTGSHPAPYTMGTGSFLWVKQPGRGVDHPPHLVPWLKKEYSYTSTLHLGFINGRDRDNMAV